MASRAAKLARRRQAARAGRPRKEGVERYPSGQIKHSAREDGVMETVLDARERIHGFDVTRMIRKEDRKSKDGEDVARLTGYVLGRIYLDGKITKDQLEAGNKYAEDVARYCRLTGIPFPSARAQDVNKVQGGDSRDVSSDALKSHANKIMKLTGALLACASGPQVKATVANVCVMDYGNLRDMPPAQMNFLRKGLNELVKFYANVLTESGKSD